MFTKIKNYYPQLLVLLQFGIIGVMILLSNGVFTSLLTTSIFSFGLALGLWALMYNKLGNFNIQPKMKEGSQLVTTGIYAYIRHPMYSAVIIIMLAVFISTPTLLETVLFVLLILVLLLKAKREERIWSEADKEYEAYIKRSKHFIPFIL